jgi:hypothetical protein
LVFRTELEEMRQKQEKEEQRVHKEILKVEHAPMTTRKTPTHQ